MARTIHSQSKCLSETLYVAHSGTSFFCSIDNTFLCYQSHFTVMNISTSCQMSFQVLCSDFIPPRLDSPSPVTYFPFFDRKYLAVAASLNGGNVLANFVKMLQEWFSAFGKYNTTKTALHSKRSTMMINGFISSIFHTDIKCQYPLESPLRGFFIKLPWHTTFMDK